MRRLGAGAVAIGVIAAVALPFLLKSFGIYLISMWAVLTIAAIGLNLTLGYAGQISLAQGAFVALRENPIRALSLGVDTRRYTLMAFAIGSSLGGLSGALYAPLVQFIEPSSFALGLSFNRLMMVIVGGSGFFFGPFVGALVAVLLPEWMRIAQGYYLILYASIVMLLMAFCPSGVIGLMGRAFNALSARRDRAATVLHGERVGA